MAKVIMNHGTGGEIMQEFLAKHVTSHFPKMKSEVPLSSFDDSAVIDDIVFTTDGHTVKPLFFPGGDIGSLSVGGEYYVIYNGGVVEGTQRDLGLHLGEMRRHMLGEELLHDLPARTVIHDDLCHDTPNYDDMDKLVVMCRSFQKGL